MRKLCLGLCFLLLLAPDSSVRSVTLEGVGQFGGGLFVPSGEDADVTRVGPAFSLLAAVGVTPHVGFEAEYAYVPLRFEAGQFPLAAEYRATQMSALAGPRIATGRFLNRGGVGIVYASLRAGFARLVTTTSEAAPGGAWVGGAIEEANTPSGAPGFQTRVTDVGLAVSPRVGAVLRLTDRTGIDASIHPTFIYNRGSITTQLFLSVQFAVWGWQTY